MTNWLQTLKIPGGGRSAIVPISILTAIKRNVAELHSRFSSGLIETVIRDFYNFELPEVPFEAKSIIVAALPRPVVKVRFHQSDKAYTCYNDGWEEDRLTLHTAEEAILLQLVRCGYQAHSYGALPLKQLAVRSGLAEYGRNNLAYVDGMGSLVQITAMLTDIPIDARLLPLRRMAACLQCSACVQSCPTGAIDPDRYIIRAERCLTYFNEFIDLAPFPKWIPTSSHHSLHGCMRCQLNCPQNRRYVERFVNPVSFDETETSILLRGAEMSELPEALAAKIRRLDLEEYLSLLPRNLSAIMNA